MITAPLAVKSFQKGDEKPLIFIFAGEQEIVNITCKRLLFVPEESNYLFWLIGIQKNVNNGDIKI